MAESLPGKKLYHDSDSAAAFPKKFPDWDLKGPFLTGFNIFCSAFDSRTIPQTLYAGGSSSHWGPTIFRSRDLGKTWQESKDSPRFSKKIKLCVKEIWQMQPDSPEYPGSIYAGVSPAALFRSDDSGETWHEIKGLTQHETRSSWKPCRGGLCLHSILVDPRNPNHLIVGISAAGVFETFNRGKTWKTTNDGIPSDPRTSCVHKLIFAGGKTGRLYQQNHLGVWRRDSEDSKWMPIDQGLPSRYGFTLTSHLENPDEVYVIPHESPEMRTAPKGKLAVYRTKNGGKTWKELSHGLPYPAYVKILREGLWINGSNPSHLFFGTTGGSLFASMDKGNHWIELFSHLPKIFSIKAAFFPNAPVQPKHS